MSVFYLPGATYLKLYSSRLPHYQEYMGITIWTLCSKRKKGSREGEADLKGAGDCLGV